MVGKIKTGSYFKGVTEYISNDKKGELLHTNMMGSQPNELIKEFQTIAEQNTRATNKVKHHIVSMAQGERLSDDKLKEITDTYLEDMGYKNNQFVVYKHNDTDIQHIHILTNRVDMDNYKCVPDSNEKRKARKILMDLEKKYNLVKTPERSQTPQLHQNKQAYNEMKNRYAKEAKEKVELLKLTDKEHIQGQVSVAMSNKPTNWKELNEGLKKSGISLELNSTRNGVSFKCNGIKYKASSISRSLSFRALSTTLGINLNLVLQAAKVLNRGLSKGFDMEM